MKISLTTNLEFINTSLEMLWEDTPSKSLDMELITGLLITLGMILGETMELSKLHSENQELTPNAMPEKFDFYYISIFIIILNSLYKMILYINISI